MDEAPPGTAPGGASFVEADGGPGVRNLPMAHVIEDPVPRDSEHSYLIQAVDLVAFLLYQQIAPNAYMRNTISSD